MADQCLTAGTLPFWGRIRLSGPAQQPVSYWRGCTYGRTVLGFRRAKKEDRDRFRIFTRIDLSLSPHRSHLSDLYSLAGMGLGAPSAPPAGRPFARLPLRVFRSSLRPCGCPFGSDGRTVRSVLPQATDSLACASEPAALRLAAAGTRRSLAFADLTPAGHSVARLVGSHDEAPVGSADEALQLPVGRSVAAGQLSGRPLP